MSFFKVTIETIARVLPHPNADRLDLIELAGLGYPIVAGKGVHAAGKRVLYFPIDSLIPAILADRIGVRKYLSGENKDRVKTVVLRGQSSQGLIAGLSLLADYGLTENSTADEITAALGVMKFSPPHKPIKGGRLLPLPDGLSVYDIENSERAAAVVEWLMDRETVITEKMEGQNVVTSVDDTDKIVIGMRENSIELEPGATHVYVETAKAERLPEFARWVLARGFRRVAVYGELLGPGLDVVNYYSLPTNRILPFDIKADGRWLPWGVALGMITDFNAETGANITPAPRLFVGTLRLFLGHQTVRAASHGPTAITIPAAGGKSRAGLLREGIVIKDAAEERMPTSFERVIVKQRDPIYLDKTGH